MEVKSSLQVLFWFDDDDVILVQQNKKNFLYIQIWKSRSLNFGHWFTEIFLKFNMQVEKSSLNLNM